MNSENKKRIKVVQQNLWLHDKDQSERLDRFQQGILKKNPDIICLQEVFGPAVRSKLTKYFQKNYQVITANYFEHKYTWKSYVPLFLFLILYWVTIRPYMENHNVLSTVIQLTFTVFLQPAVLKMVIIQYIYFLDRKLNPQKQGQYDFMAEMICLKEQEFEEVKVVKTQAFRTDGYPYPNFGKKYVKEEGFFFRIIYYLHQWYFYYIQVTFMRPGYMIATAKHKATQRNMIICSTHLVIGIGGNEQRIHQTKELHYEIQKIAYENKCQYDYIIGGDFNGVDKDPEFQYLKDQEMKDSFRDFMEKIHPNIDPNSITTWDNVKNPYVQDQPEWEPNGRIDYIFYGKTNIVNDQIKAVKGGLNPIHSARIFDQPGQLVSDHYGFETTFEIQY